MSFNHAFEQRGLSDQCPCCCKLYDNSTNRCVQDACGHMRCFMCVFQSVRCVMCLHSRQSTSAISHSMAQSKSSKRSSHHQSRSNDNPSRDLRKSHFLPVQAPASVEAHHSSLKKELPGQPVETTEDEEDHHYFLYQPLDVKEEASTSVSSKKESLALPVGDPAVFANARLMTPIAEEENQLSSDEDIDLDSQDVVTTPVQDHIYCSISDDDLPSKVFEDSLAEGSFPDIARPTIGIAPRLPPRKPEFNTINTLPTPSSSNNSSSKLVFDKSGQSQGSSESLKSLSTESSSHTVRNCGTVIGSMMAGDGTKNNIESRGFKKGFERESMRETSSKVSHNLLATQPVSIQSGSKMNKSTSLSNVFNAAGVEVNSVKGANQQSTHPQFQHSTHKPSLSLVTQPVTSSSQSSGPVALSVGTASNTKYIQQLSQSLIQTELARGVAGEGGLESKSANSSLGKTNNNSMNTSGSMNGNSANNDINPNPTPSLPAGFWSNCSVVRFDLPEYSLDASICGRGWLLSSIEDVLLQSSFEGDVSTKGAVIVGSSGTGKTKLITHLALHSTIAQQLFVEIADLRKVSSRSRESLDESSRSADSLQLDSNHSSLKSNGSTSASISLINPQTQLTQTQLLGTAGLGQPQHNDTMCSNHSTQSGCSSTHTPARCTHSYELNTSNPHSQSHSNNSTYDSKQDKDSPASTVDSGIKTSPGNTLGCDNTSDTENSRIPPYQLLTSVGNHQESPGSFNVRNYFSTSSSAGTSQFATSNYGFFLSQRVLAAFFCQNCNQKTLNPANVVHTLMYHAQIRVASYRRVLEEDESVRKWASAKECWKDPLVAIHKGLISPMNSLLADGQVGGNYFIIMIDSLVSTDSGLIEFVIRLADIMPSWAKLLCTCSKDTYSLFGTLKQNLEVFNLEDPSKDCDITKDLDAFISQQVNNCTSSARDIITASRESSAKFRNLLMSNSQRSFLYIRSCFDIINSGAITLTKTLNKNSLPSTLHGIFELLCNQICHSSLAIYSKLRVILDVIGCSFYPMTVEEIWTVVSFSKCGKEEFDRNFELVHGHFLIMRTNRTFEFSSDFLRTWFLDPSLAKKFSCDLRNGHALHAISAMSSLTSSPKKQNNINTNNNLTASNKLDMVRHLVLSGADVLGNSNGANAMYDSPMMVGANNAIDFMFRDQKVQWVNWLCKQSELNSILASRHFLNSPDLKVAEFLLRSGADANTRCSELDQTTLLSAFCYLGHFEIVSLLLSYGSDVNLADGPSGRSPLISACMKGHVDICDLLLQSGADVKNSPDVCGMSPVEHAAASGFVECVRMLINMSSVESVERALVLTAYNGHKHVVEFLLKGGYISNDALDAPFPVPIRDSIASSTQSSSVSFTEETAMTAAASRGFNETCCVLAGHGASLTAKNGQGLTPLLAAVDCNQEDMIFDLISLKDAQAKTDPLTVDQEVERDETGRTALLIGAAKGSQVIVEYLLQCGSSVRETDNENMSALCWAVRQGHSTIAEMLLDDDSDVNHRDSRGRSPLDFAASLGDESLLQLLLNYGADFDKTCNAGLRPLDYAVQADKLNCVALLMRKGARIGQAAWKTAISNPQIMLLFLNKLTEDGSIFYRQKKYPDAMKRFTLALRKFPRQKHEFGAHTTSFRDLKVTLYLNISRCNRKINKLDNAIHYANRALNLKPGCYEGYYARARARRASRDFKGATDDLKEACNIAPDNSEIVCLLQRVKLEAALHCGEIGSINSNGGKGVLNQFKNYSLNECGPIGDMSTAISMASGGIIDEERGEIDYRGDIFDDDEGSNGCTSEDTLETNTYGGGGSMHSLFAATSGGGVGSHPYNAHSAHSRNVVANQCFAVKDTAL